MDPLPRDATDAQLLRYVDEWVALLEAEDYDAAFRHTDHDPFAGWSADLLRFSIKSYGAGTASQRATLTGEPTDIDVCREVTRWSTPRPAGVGQIWYDLYIDGRASDLTATFWIVSVPGGLVLQLEAIHVM